MSIRRILRNKKFKKFLSRLSSLTDKRMKGKVKHPISSCLLIIILAELSGCNYFREFVAFANEHKNQLTKLGLLPNGVPSHDTLERIVHQVDRFELDELLLKTLFQQIDGRPIISIDGKNLRATKDSSLNGTYQGMKNILTAFLCDSKLSLLSESKGDKGNEMTTIPCLIDRIHEYFPNLKPIISIDAIGITNEILTKLNEYKYDFVICYKRSELTLKEIELSCDGTEIISDLTKNSARIETRKFSLHSPENIVGIEQWVPHIEHIGRMDSIVENIKTNKKTENKSFYFTSEITVNEFMNVRRHHWAIENSLHYILDNSFKEDRLRIKKGSASENMNLLRKFVLNVIALTNFKNESVSAYRDSMKYFTARQLLYRIVGVLA